MIKDSAQSGPNSEAWENVPASLCHFQSVLPDAVLVGGTASALSAGHRLSFDHDHVRPDLRERFDAVLAQLEAVCGWQTARVQRPILILGSVDGVETGGAPTASDTATGNRGNPIGRPQHHHADPAGGAAHQGLPLP
jgi:hypothetical protein